MVRAAGLVTMTKNSGGPTKPKGMKMPLYETVFIVRQDLSAKQVEDLAKGFGQIVNDNGGSTKRTESWGLRNLAYRIKKNRKGHYTLMHFDAPPKAIAEMERNIRINEDVLRYMTVSIEKLPEGPSPILRQSDEGEEGGFAPRGDRPYRDRSSSDRPARNFDRAPAADKGE
jgi:small subunit ribosomal protein S6